MRILIADDEPVSARALKELLEMEGHQVIGPAPDGAEAVRLAGSQQPDLAILDIDMPRMSGLEAIERISRARPIPTIVLTAHGDAEYVTRAAALPVFTYLRKPSGAGELFPAIRLAAARFKEWKALSGRVTELSARMEERKTIERAKGILMEIRGIAERDAYRLLQRESQQRGRSMVDVARAVISAQGVFRRPGASAPPPAAAGA